MAVDREKEAALIHRGLNRVEFFDLTTGEADGLQDILDSMAGEGRRRFSFHAPVIRPDYFPHSGVTCFFLNEDEAKRQLSFRLLDHTMEAARRWGAEYVVTHLTFGPTDSKDQATALRLAGDACRRMAGMSRDYGIPLDLEFAAYSNAFNRADLFAEAVAPHPELGVCIDVGHAFLGAIRRQRDYLEDIAALAPRTRSLHLWNSLGEEHTKRHHHTPLHPSQKPDEGWIDIEKTMALVLHENPRVNIIYEYPVDAVTTEIQEGYDWIADMVSRPLLRKEGPGEDFS
ncbi:MAG: hypothetical protein A3G18_06775 [Rhodospirillales bacterium RIFCSPLOWO2_12_FULL_58_28]|nr:MAG: hypothetical protein A3H92_11340 [Rhodospirillales bacterium RIFCSPLOWO2_02_FULL_58_16]OHC77426.1 MAG: hypothetical protein A3G18_06775 [Rhodospirillales bacterium RIFCSPLOWO2_12_FULL_58_28]